MQAVLQFILPILLFLTSVFLILLVLIQRGRGGGLAGAFGGLGGQSAFGTKAGDLFTRITIIVATCWIILCAASVKLLNDSGSSLISPNLGGSATGQQQPGAAPPSSGAAPQKSPAAAPATTTKSPATSPADKGGTPPKAESSAPAGGAAPEPAK